MHSTNCALLDKLNRVILNRHLFQWISNDLWLTCVLFLCICCLIPQKISNLVIYKTHC